MKKRKQQSSQRPVIHGIQPAPRNITAFAGLAPIVDLWDGIGMPAIVEDVLSLKKRKRGFSQASFVLSSALVQLIGGNGVDDFDRLREDPELLDLLGVSVPARTTANDFFNAFTIGHVRQLEKMQSRAMAAAYKPRYDPDTSTATLDVDSTYATVYGHQQGADRLYTGEVGFHPIACFRAETREAVHVKLRRGHASSAGDTDSLLEFVEQAFASLPAKFPTRRLRADSAFCVVALFAWLQDQGIEFAVTAAMTKRIKEAIETLEADDTAWTAEPGGKPDPGGRKHRPHRALKAPELAECEVDLSGSKGHRVTVRLVVRRRRAAQPGLFADAKTKYHAVATNRFDLSPVELLKWADGRGDAENCIRELKNDLDAFGCGFRQFAANAAWMHMGVLVYNLMCWLRLTCPATSLQAESWQVRTWRTRLFSIPGYLVRTGRRLLLTLAAAGPIFALLHGLSAKIAAAYG